MWSYATHNYMTSMNAFTSHYCRHLSLLSCYSFSFPSLLILQYHYLLCLSCAQGSHHNVHFHLPDSAIGNAPLSLSSLSKPSPTFAFSPFLSFCLRETMLESRGTKIRLEPASNPPSAPTSPPFPSSRPNSCQLVDRSVDQ